MFSQNKRIPSFMHDSGYSATKASFRGSHRNRSTSYYDKRAVSNTRTYSRRNAAKACIRVNPLFVTASSWIVITPNVFASKLMAKGSQITPFKKQIGQSNCIRLGKSNISSNLLGVDNRQIMLGENYNTIKEIASLTKIMTCYTVLQLTLKYLSKQTTMITVSKRASEEVGTSGKLQQGHTFSVWDLLHALMLPSGNDAAIALAEYFGDFLLTRDKDEDINPLTNQRIVKDTAMNDILAREKSKLREFTKLSSLDSYGSCSKSSTRGDTPGLFPAIKNSEREDNSDYSFSDHARSVMYSSSTEKSNSFSFEHDIKASSFTKYVSKGTKSMFRSCPKITRFLLEMNKNAKKLGMNNSHFDSPHGLANRNNKSTAYDLALLCAACIKMPDFNRIVRTKTYACKSRSKPFAKNSISMGAGFNNNSYSWTNTNKLLNRGFVGIKTGVTLTAGPCLASHFKSRKRSYLVIVLNCNTLDQRFVDTNNIIDHCQAKIRCGQIDDLKPESKAPKSPNFDLFENDISLPYEQSYELGTQDSPTKSIPKSETKTLGTFDEDGSTSLSSSSPICTNRKSLF